MISVIIPFYNEEDQLEKTLKPLKPFFEKIEIIAVNGQSTDQSLEILKKYPNILVLESEQGRAVQMNNGAKHAKGNTFLFLHADTVLEENWFDELQNTEEKFLAGAYSFKPDQRNWFINIVELLARIRIFFNLHTPYGDQAIWVRREAFEKIEGYKQIPIMEEVDLIDRLKKFSKIKILNSYAYTAIRRWQDEGHFRATIKNITALLLYRFKVDFKIIRKIYNSDSYPWAKKYRF